MSLARSVCPFPVADAGFSPAGVCCQPQQDAAHPRHPPQEPDQAHRVPQQVSERQDRG